MLQTLDHMKIGHALADEILDASDNPLDDVENK